MPKYPSQRKYEKEKCKTVTLKFYPPDFDLVDWLNDQPNKTGYIKQLIRDDMSDDEPRYRD